MFGESEKPVPLLGKHFALSMGPQRAGTTWLDRYLRYRGDICLPEEVKEVFFFDRHYDRGEEFYKSHFKVEQAHRLVMEISTTSFDHADAPRRVFEIFGEDVTLLCPMRHPILRSYSLYQHFRRYGIVTGSLQEAVKEAPQIIFSSRYSEHLERWSNYFGLDKINIVFQEDLEDDCEAYVRQVCEILDLPFIAPDAEVADKLNVTTSSNNPFVAGMAQNMAEWLRDHKLYAVVNVAKTLGLKPFVFGKENPETLRGEIPLEDYEWLRERLFDETDKLESLLGYRLDVWRKRLP